MVDSVIKPTHNYALNHGGIKSRDVDGSPKEQLMTKSFMSVKQPPSARNNNII